MLLAQQAAETDINSGLAVIGYGLGAIGGGIGVGMIFSSVISGTARQPEAQGKLMNIGFTTFALVEVLALLGPSGCGLGRCARGAGERGRDARGGAGADPKPCVYVLSGSVGRQLAGRQRARGRRGHKPAERAEQPGPDR